MDLSGELLEFLPIWHQQQCKCYDNTLVNVPIQTASACSESLARCLTGKITTKNLFL